MSAPVTAHLRCHPPRAFTLIELLVVLLVVGLLIAIAYPSLRQARRAAQTAACLSNLSQIGVMLNVYLIDSDGLMPALQNRERTADPLPAMDTALVRTGDGADVFACPADSEDFFESTGTSYFWNFTVNGQRVDRLFSIIGGTQAERIPLVSDREGFHFDLRDRVNILYADGHAESELTFTLPQSPP